ncbi:MAG: hypothetical protein ACI91R_001539 [Vicingaceae bacterium]|jgi:hypothetical protein
MVLSLKTYNSIAFVACRSYCYKNIEMKDYNNGQNHAKGKAEARAIFEAYFETYPNLYFKAIDRMHLTTK